MSDWASPPTYAKEIAIKVDKVYSLIAAGEITAVNVAADPRGKPRYRISRTEWERWLESRSTKPPEPKPRRRRRAATPAKEYF
jgi:excisionase family DNA binding protein